MLPLRITSGMTLISQVLTLNMAHHYQPSQQNYAFNQTQYINTYPGKLSLQLELTKCSKCNWYLEKQSNNRIQIWMCNGKTCYKGCQQDKLGHWTRRIHTCPDNRSVLLEVMPVSFCPSLLTLSSRDLWQLHQYYIYMTYTYTSENVSSVAWLLHGCPGIWTQTSRPPGLSRLKAF
jgi:hypothetical protein